MVNLPGTTLSKKKELTPPESTFLFHSEGAGMGVCGGALHPPLLRSLLRVRERSGLVFLGHLALLWSSVRSGGRRCVEVSLSVADRHLLFAL